MLHTLAIIALLIIIVAMLFGRAGLAALRWICLLGFLAVLGFVAWSLYGTWQYNQSPSTAGANDPVEVQKWAEIQKRQLEIGRIERAKAQEQIDKAKAQVQRMLDESSQDN